MRSRLVIIGSGLQGLHLALAALASGRYTTRDLLIVDRHPEPFARWRTFTDRLHMRFLRSGALQHIGLRVHDLLHFAQTNVKLRVFSEPHRRPSLKLFNAHVSSLLRLHDLERSYMHAEFLGVEPRKAAGWKVLLQQGELEAEKVIVATGQAEELRWPTFLHELRAEDAPVEHVFTPGSLPRVTRGQSVAVIGNGLSAFHLSRHLSMDVGARVWQLSRREPSVSWFDATPSWSKQGAPSRLQGLSQYKALLKVLPDARNGSVPPDILDEAKRCMTKTDYQLLVIPEMTASLVGKKVVVRSERFDRAFDQVFCATGFAGIPRTPWLIRCAEEMALPVDANGYPVLDAQLQWASGLHLVGPYARLVVGPFASNIAGVRLAATRIF